MDTSVERACVGGIGATGVRRQSGAEPQCAGIAAFLRDLWARSLHRIAGARLPALIGVKPGSGAHR
ncbi:MAG: hypothetical protein ACT6S0_07170 [Roseateles sp.]|uniref:hypothetical protein n=1 Tax=Roseateles sp. TaxID=1971397 RepID=UPI0040361023